MLSILSHKAEPRLNTNWGIADLTLATDRKLGQGYISVKWDMLYFTYKYKMGLGNVRVHNT